jgi:hypothetical protein
LMPLHLLSVVHGIQYITTHCTATHAARRRQYHLVYKIT